MKQIDCLGAKLISKSSRPLSQSFVLQLRDYRQARLK